MSTATETSTQKPGGGAIPGAIPYLSLDGALKAAEFYRKAFGAEQEPDHRAGREGCPPDEQGRTMHVYLTVNGGPLMMSDFYPEHGYAKVDPQGYMLHLQVDDIDAWWNRAVEAGAEVKVPVQDMFWGDRYGQLRDPFGVTWSMGMTPRK